MLKRIHHFAITCSNYEKSRDFYTRILGLSIEKEIFRGDRSPYRLNLALNGNFTIELFLSSSSVSRSPNYGVRHLAFAVADLAEAIDALTEKGIETEEVLTDEATGRRFTFLRDPDGLPIELSEGP